MLQQVFVIIFVQQYKLYQLPLLWFFCGDGHCDKDSEDSNEDSEEDSDKDSDED